MSLAWWNTARVSKPVTIDPGLGSHRGLLRDRARPRWAVSEQPMIEPTVTRCIYHSSMISWLL